MKRVLAYQQVNLAIGYLAVETMCFWLADFWMPRQEREILEIFAFIGQGFRKL